VAHLLPAEVRQVLHHRRHGPRRRCSRGTAAGRHARLGVLRPGTIHHAFARPINPLIGTFNYSATSNNMNSLQALAADGWAATFGTARTALGGATGHPGPSSLYQM